MVSGWHALGYLGLVGLVGCAPPPASAVDEELKSVSLDTFWETALTVSSGGNAVVIGGRVPSPQPVRDATARCLGRRCTATVLPREAFIEMRLVVIGLEAGTDEVELRYRLPDADEWRSKRLHFLFAPEASLPELTLGLEREPKGPYLFRELPAELTSQGLKPPARCERYMGHATCFPRETVAGVARFPSCAQSMRCFDLRGGMLYNGFWLNVHEGRAGVDSISSYIDRGGQRKQTGLWELNGKETSP